VPAGATSLPDVSNSGFTIGQRIVIDAGTAIEEYNNIIGFGSLILETPLKYDHGPGAVISTAAALTPTDVPIGVTGSSATLDPAGFLQTTKLCCPIEMEIFFGRVLDSMGYSVCSKPHIQGLVHWFSCVPDMDFQYMIQVIEQGNPCKYWAEKDTVCPTLSPECAGTWCR
jgi:hypothetical protein